MMAIFLKYKSINLIIFYYCTYSVLLGTIGVVVQNSIEVIRNKEFGPQVNDWNRVWSILEKGEKSVDIKWYVTRDQKV